MGYSTHITVNIAILVGKTIIEITKTDDEIVFLDNQGFKYKMYHQQDCCESVSIDDICGDLNDLIGTKIVKASEDTSNSNPTGIEKNYQESFTWTFYNLATTKGHVTIRWYGSSNGYYSERVDFIKYNDNFLDELRDVKLNNVLDDK